MIKVYHLNCGTSRPYPAQLINGKGGFWRRGTVVCHCLLLETPDGLMLVDTGFGRDDVQHPLHRLGAFFYYLTQPSLQLSECAIEQIRRLGFLPQAIKHIFISHLDLDHIGGLSDFPQAKIHILKAELDALLHRKFFKEQWGYRTQQVAHQPLWVTHECDKTWFGFPATQPLANYPDLLMISLPGHSRGHAGIAIKQANTWLVHAGDAYAHPGQLKQPPSLPLGLKLFQNLLVTIDKIAREQTLKALRTLKQENGPKIELISAHSLEEFERYF